MGRFGEKSVSLYCSKHFMTQHSPYMAPDEVHYVPAGVMPWPVRNDDVWLVTGVLVKDCLDLTNDMIPSFAMKGYQLRSFPLLLGQLTAKELRYNFPGQKLGIGDLNEIEFRKTVATALGLEMNPAAGYFIRKHPAEEGFLVMEIQASTHQKFLLAASKYLRQIPENVEITGIRFSKIKRDDVHLDMLHDSAAEVHPYGADPELAKLASDVEAKIAELVMQDFPVEVIETWLQKAVKLSRLKVTSDYRILLPDYDKEIKLRQLPKALFIWMLKHKDGCRLKDLSDHKAEILDIYRKLTILDDDAQAVASIEALVNPIGNSFSEKCAAIKYAFLNEIPDRIAQNYYVHGPQGGAKRISLDRSLVDWEVEV